MVPVASIVPSRPSLVVNQTFHRAPERSATDSPSPWHFIFGDLAGLRLQRTNTIWPRVGEPKPFSNVVEQLAEVDVGAWFLSRRSSLVDRPLPLAGVAEVARFASPLRRWRRAMLEYTARKDYGGELDPNARARGCGERAYRRAGIDSSAFTAVPASLQA